MTSAYRRYELATDFEGDDIPDLTRLEAEQQPPAKPARGRGDLDQIDAARDDGRFNRTMEQWLAWLRAMANRHAAFVAASRPLAESLTFKPGDDLPLRSRSRPSHTYRMLVLPEGYVVHQDEGCEGEPFNGPLACWHSKNPQRYVMTNQALTQYREAASPVAIAFNDEQLSVIKSTIAKGATDTELTLFIATCKRTGLDPFLKQIYAVKRWDSKERREVMAIQVGIDGLRLIAERTNKYAGMDPVEWLDEDGVWSEVWTGAGAHPIAARTAVYRKDFERKVPAVARWDSYVQTFTREKEVHLSPMWEKMPDVMIGKCVESLAMRRAFPAEMSGLASVIDSEYDPAIEVQELHNAAPEQQRDESKVVDGEVVKRAPVTAAQLATLRKVWDPQHTGVGELRRRFPHVFPQPTPGASNNVKALSEEEAQIAIELLSAKPEAPAGVSGGATAEKDRISGAANETAPTPPACEHESVFDDEKALHICGLCGIALEGPQTQAEGAQPTLV